MSETAELKAQIEALTKRLDQIQGVQPGSEQDEGPPEWAWDAEKGKLRTFLPSMPTENGQLHFLCAPGIGDFMWNWAKMWKLAETRDITFWFQDDREKRVKQYTDLMGIKTGFCRVDIHELLECPGEFTEEDLKDGGVFYLHSNRHIEAGKRIEEWMPWLPIKNPAPTVHGRWKGESGKPGDYLLMHVGHFGYQGHNWPPRMWARTIRTIQEDFGMPVMLIGAMWDEAYCNAVCELVEPRRSPCMNMPWEYAIKMMVNSRGMIGVDSGSAITAKYLGVPTISAYPRWLCDPSPTKAHRNGTHMPGAWELDTHELSSWCYFDEALDKDAENNVLKWTERLLK